MRASTSGFNIFIYPSPKRKCLNHGVARKPDVVHANAPKNLPEKR
jgi:hypothetical protein